MATAEFAGRLKQLELPQLQEIKRGHSEGIKLKLGEEPILIDGFFILSLRYTEESRIETGITRKSTIPATLLKKDGSIRTYGYVPRYEPEPVFDTVFLGIRPSRPVIFVSNGDYRILYVTDDLTSVSVVLESKKRLIKRSIPVSTNLEQFMKDLYDQGKLSREAEEELLMQEDSVATHRDFISRMEYQARRYTELRKKGKLTPEWIDWGFRHRAEIAKAAS